jgi:hypothetical protein
MVNSLPAERYHLGHLPQAYLFCFLFGVHVWSFLYSERGLTGALLRASGFLPVHVFGQMSEICIQGDL